MSDRKPCVSAAAADVHEALDGLWTGNRSERAIIDLLRDAANRLDAPWTPSAPPERRRRRWAPDRMMVAWMAAMLALAAAVVLAAIWGCA